MVRALSFYLAFKLSLTKQLSAVLINCARIEAQLVIATPGRALNLIQRKRMAISQVKIFALKGVDDILFHHGLATQIIRIQKYVQIIVCVIVN